MRTMVFHTALFACMYVRMGVRAYERYLLARYQVCWCANKSPTRSARSCIMHDGAVAFLHILEKYVYFVLLYTYFPIII